MMIKFSRPDIENFFRTIKIENFEVDPAEKQLIFSTNINGKFNLWGMDLPQTFPYPLTFVDQSNHGIMYDPNGEFVILAHDRDGDEKSQIYAMPPQGGQVRPLRVKEGERHMPITLSEDGKKLYYVSTKDNPQYLKSYCWDLEREEEKVVLEKEDRLTTLRDVSPGENSIAFQEVYGNTYQKGFLRTGNNEEIELIPDARKGEAGEYAVVDCKFISDDELYFLTNYGEDFHYLARFDISGRKCETVKVLEGEDIISLEYDKKNKGFYLGVNTGVESKLYYYDVNTGELSEIPIPVSTIEKIKVSEKGGLYLQGNSAVSPSNIFRKTPENNEWEQLTDINVPGVSKKELVDAEAVTYQSYDGLEIEALFFRAHAANSNGKIIFWPHGGPQSIERKTFRPLFQFLLNSGYSIFAPNFRGSDGYGTKFKKMVEGDWGYGPRLDCVAGMDWLIAKGYVEKGEIILMGGSYGGYMALLLHGRHPEYFTTIIDIFGVSNLFTFVDSVPDFWKPLMRQLVGDPEKNKEKFEEDSPINYTENMSKPMLVIQGANDPRVVKKESDQMVEAIEKAGNEEVEYLILEDEGHGFSKKENEIKVYRRILDFLEKTVGK